MPPFAKRGIGFKANPVTKNPLRRKPSSDHRGDCPDHSGCPPSVGRKPLRREFQLLNRERAHSERTSLKPISVVVEKSARASALAHFDLD